MGKFEKNLAYGKFAENIIKQFFINKGYEVQVDEDYGFMPDDINKGPRMLVLRPGNYNSIEDAEANYEEIIAPDLMITKGNVRKYLEVKRRGELSRFNGEDILYIKALSWYDYCELDFLCEYHGYGNGVVIFLYVDDFHGRQNKIFYAPVTLLKEHIQYHKKNRYVAFNLKYFLEFN